MRAFSKLYAGNQNEARGRFKVLVKLCYELWASEVCGLVLEQVEAESRGLHIVRLKGGFSTTHPLRSDEIRTIKAWLVGWARMKAPGKDLGRSFFLSERRKPLHRSSVNLLLHKYGYKARLPVAVHPHMLRHACGFALADQGGALQRYLRDHGRLVRVSRREHEKGIHPWGHHSLDALGADERPYLDKLAAPEREAPASEDLVISAEALLQRLSANEAAILRLRVLESRSLWSIAGELGISTLTVSRHEEAALAALREQLA